MKKDSELNECLKLDVVVVILYCVSHTSIRMPL